MKIILDTNIVLDSLLSREPYSTAANSIIRLIAKETVFAYINASSITDIYYILNKKYGDNESRNKIRILLNILQAIEVTHGDCVAALDYPMSDFEDALVTVCSEKIGADFIITRDVKFLKIPKAISPGDFLEKISF